MAARMASSRMRPVPVPGVADGGDRLAPHPDTIDDLALGAYLMTTDKRGISALLLQRQLGLRRYEMAWLILHKLRRAMRCRSVV